MGELDRCRRDSGIGGRFAPALALGIADVGGRARAGREPVQRRVGQDEFLPEQFGGRGVGRMAPGLQLVEHPGQLGNRAVRSHGTDECGTGGLHGDVAELVLHELPDPAHAVLFDGAEPRQGIVVEFLGKGSECPVDVHPDDALRCEPADLRSHVPADVPALDSELVVAQPGHQLQERSGYPGRGPS